MENMHADVRVLRVNNIFYYIKQTDSMFPWVCTVIDHRRYPNAMTTSVTPLAALCATF